MQDFGRKSPFVWAAAVVQDTFPILCVCAMQHSASDTLTVCELAVWMRRCLFIVPGSSSGFKGFVQLVLFSRTIPVWHVCEDLSSLSPFILGLACSLQLQLNLLLCSQVALLEMQRGRGKQVSIRHFPLVCFLQMVLLPELSWSKCAKP